MGGGRVDHKTATILFENLSMMVLTTGTALTHALLDRGIRLSRIG
jgi:hypothetical protein